MSKKLSAYRKRRDFKKTPEPKGKSVKKSKAPIFVIQKHQATHLHYDFRLEMDGALKSWAVPKGPSTQPSDKRLAMLTEDHPLEYGKFEGVIPEGYGAGTVMLWDFGTFKNIKKDKKGEIIPIEKCFEMGRIEIELKGKKLQGGYALIRFRGENNWLLIKMRDAFADKKKDILEKEAKSAKSGKTLKQIADGKEKAA